MSSAMDCELCTAGYFDTIQKFHRNSATALEEFRRHGVLPRVLICPTCGQDCLFKPSSNTFFCEKTVRDIRGRKRKCSFSVSERKGTFLDKTRLQPCDLLLFVALFLQKARTQRDAQSFLKLNSETCVNWNSFCYEVCEYWLGEQAHIGGPGRIVELDESKFGKSKYNRGCDIQEKWVFGLYERDSKKLLLFAVDERDSATLVPIIQRLVLPGTTIYSDEWVAYRGLSGLGYVHRTVNRSKQSVAEGGVHIQNIERSWRGAKLWVLRSGNKVDMYNKYLARYLFCRACPQDERMHHFLKCASQLYTHPNAA